MECEVNWALGSITLKKASEGYGIPSELFQILKDAAANELHSICQKIWKTQQGPKDCTIALISHTNKVMLKILKARLQQYMNWEFSDVQAGFRKGRGTREQIANTRWIIEKAREFKNKSTSASLIVLKAFIV